MVSWAPLEVERGLEVVAVLAGLGLRSGCGLEWELAFGLALAKRALEELELERLVPVLKVRVLKVLAMLRVVEQLVGFERLLGEQTSPARPGQPEQ